MSMREVGQAIILINGYIQHKRGTLRVDGREVLCVALDQTCVFVDSADESDFLLLTGDQIWVLWKHIVPSLRTPPHLILGTRWWNTGNACIGAVAVETFQESGEWKACIGVVSGEDIRSDTLMIVDAGAALTAEEAHGIFPGLDTRKYEEKHPS